MATLKHPCVGDVRPSQVIFSYGVGALIDLPHISVLVMGLNDWNVGGQVSQVIEEERLLETIRVQLGPQVKQLLGPPALSPEDEQIAFANSQNHVGIPVALFPRWLVCPRCQRLAPLSVGLFKRIDDLYHPERTRYVHEGCDASKEKNPVAVPARFLVACEHGHLDDFPWIEFAHRGPTNCRPKLRLIEYGPSGEARDLEVRCETCKASRRLSDAFGDEGRKRMPQCRGRRPHLRDTDPTPCDQHAKTILLGASNLWFASAITALAIPTEPVRLAQLVAEKWSTLANAKTSEFLTFARQLSPEAFRDFIGYTDAQIWDTIERKRAADAAGERPSDIPDLKRSEWEQLAQPASHTPTKDFRLRETAVPSGFADTLARVVLVERLREVRALIGFTRIDAPGEYGEELAAAEVRRAPISRQPPAWVPAAEVRGEGIFIQLREDALAAWLRQGAVQQRDGQFFSAHVRWRQSRHLTPPEAFYPTMRYVLLHSFAHALMRQLVLECGYTAASLRERIYASVPAPDQPAEPMAGVLIYTAAPDSEGTLGGLVSLGETAALARHLRAALRDAEQCASDPLCAEHEPGLRGTTVHAAACHACLFAPETSCERGNKYLDRSALIPTMEQADIAFFPPSILHR